MEENVELIRACFEQQGISFDKGLTCCSDSLKIYKEILNIAVETYGEKSIKLKQFYEAKDYSNYMIEIHGLKSSMRLLGALELGDLAEQQELSIKQKRESFIEETYHEMLNRYYQLTLGIYETLATYGWLREGNILGEKQI